MSWFQLPGRKFVRIVEDASGGYAKIEGIQNFLNNKLDEKLKCSTVVSVEIFFLAFIMDIS